MRAPLLKGFRLPHQGPRSRELDFVRGVAILLVMGLHFYTGETHNILYRALELPGHAFGFAGVDIFFVLSGFLVGGLLLKEYKKTGKIDPRQFIFRRGFKIWPAYYAFIFVEAVTHAHPLNTFLWQNLLHLQNYVGSSILHTWTLSLEEHFYLALAFTMAWMASRGWQPERILKTFVVVMGVVFCIRCLTVCMGWPGAWEFTHNRIDSLLCGVCLAILFHFYPERFEALALRPMPLALIAAAAVAFTVTVTDEAIRSSVGLTIIYIGAAAFLLLVYRHSSKLKDVWLYRLVATIGVYSYGIYLWNNSIRGPSTKLAAHVHGPLHWPVLMALDYGLGILAGVVTTVLIEWPLLRVRNRLFPQKVQDVAGPGGQARADVAPAKQGLAV